MAGMRDNLTHGYFAVDLELVWNTVKEQLPPLKKQILKLLEANNSWKKLWLPEGIVVARNFDNFPLAGKVQQITFDLTEIEKIPELVEEVGSIDILVNNAGIMNTLPY